MPRDTLEIPWSVQTLQVLDEDGEVDEDLLPELDDDALKELHRAMVFAREFDQRLLHLQKQGRIGTFAPVTGQEAAQIGSASALRDDDWLVPAFRETAAALWRGLDPASLILYNGGYNEGGALDEDAHDLPIAIPVASQIPHAAGIAYAAKLRGTDEVVMTYFGDGATSEGDFHEALNFAALYDLPVVFVCQNNQWAISTPREDQTGSKSLAQKALAYGMPGVKVDGNDLLAVRLASDEAVERARNGDGPTLIEAVTYRLEVHTTVDDPSKYRDEEEVERWQEREPIERIEGYLRGRGLLDDDGAKKIRDEIEERIDEAWKKAEKQMEEAGAPEDMFDHLYAEPTSELERQRAEVEGRGTSASDDGDEDAADDDEEADADAESAEADAKKEEA